MPKLMTQMAMFFLILNLSVGAVMATPIAEDLGIQEQVAGDEKVSAANETAGKVTTGSPGGSTLFGLYNTITRSLTTITNVLTAGPTMLKQLGFPKQITEMLEIVMGVTYALGIASFVRGYSL